MKQDKPKKAFISRSSSIITKSWTPRTKKGFKEVDNIISPLYGSGSGLVLLYSELEECINMDKRIPFNELANIINAGVAETEVLFGADDAPEQNNGGYNMSNVVAPKFGR